VVVAQTFPEATSNQRGKEIENFQSIIALILDYLDQQGYYFAPEAVVTKDVLHVVNLQS